MSIKALHLALHITVLSVYLFNILILKITIRNFWEMKNSQFIVSSNN